ncbi:MAG: Adenylate kinase [Bacteroidetes bacterium ADurb.Bin217]|nr:MAG: Adenylate kinase [Bacteroidetes bacterium ADurb.Bin217]
MLNIVLFGPPGAGKGTQSDLIVEKFDLVHISTGDLLRAEIKKQSDLGKQAQQLIDKGLLMPDSIMIDIIQNKLSEHIGCNGFIFDGFPRTSVQAQALDKLLNQNNMEVSTMISLEVDTPVIVQRILERGKVSGRADDKDESIILKRIEEYQAKTAPVKEFYKKQQKLTEITGVGTIDEIFSKIEEVCCTFV